MDASGSMTAEDLENEKYFVANLLNNLTVGYDDMWVCTPIYSFVSIFSMFIVIDSIFVYGICEGTNIIHFNFRVTSNEIIPAKLPATFYTSTKLF